MATPKFEWKIRLRLNLLTKDATNDYIAEVSTTGNTKRNEDIARGILNEGSEIKYDTLLSVLNQRDRVVRRMVQEGYRVMDGCVQITPRVLGCWTDENAKFDPALHKVTIDTVAAAEMRQALSEIGVEVLGVKNSAAYIGLVTDTATGRTDGTITPNDDIQIEGEKLKIAPEGEAKLGVFFIDSKGKSTAVTRRLTENNPKKLIARVPALPAGTYTLQVVTRFTAGATPLKEARTIVYSKPLIVS